MCNQLKLAAVFSLFVGCQLHADTQRVDKGLLALYDFTDTNKAVILDKSGSEAPIHLRVENLSTTRRSKGSFEIRGKILIRSNKPATKIIEAVKASGEISIEAWVRPANTKQDGPARIVTISSNSSNRNVTLGQDGNKFDVRLRTTSTNKNGLPSLSSKSGSLRRKLQHVVYTRNRNGLAKMYINGRENAKREVSGSFANWDKSSRLALGNEFDKNRPWKGTFHLVAIFGRQLSAAEVKQNFDAGVELHPKTVVAKAVVDPRVVHFETKVAPLLSDRCLECHDSATKKGDLDLSKKLAAFEGGESGKVLVPGNVDESSVWSLVESNDMPLDRPSLSASEKQILRKWIEDGSVWSIEKIDPALYAHAGQTNQNFLQRLTVSEYIETVKHTFGVDISKEAREILPPDLRADGFSNTAYNLNVDLKHVNGYATLADIVVGRIDIRAFARRFKRKLLFTDKEMGDLIEKMGKWILRGPIDKHEVIVYRGISTTVASAGGSYEDAVGYIIEAMIQSPRFIYRIENQRGDGTANPVNEYELASRLSYIIWGGPPDKDLMDAAEDGDLFDPSSVEQHVARMLNDPRAVEHSARFISDWLNLGRLANMRPNQDRFPNWKPELAIDMKNETLAFFDEVVWNQKRPLSDLLNAQVTFATPRLTQHYGFADSVQAADGENGDILKIDLKSEPNRGGLLTQGSVLTVGGDEASMVTRGLLVMHELLRGVVKDPPPCVDTTPKPTRAGVSQRTIAMARIADNTCGGCHKKFEPLAFGLEKFDGLGSFHQKDEHGNELREDGEVLFPGDEEPIEFKTSSELMNLLANSDRVKESITWKLTQFALGRPLIAEDAGLVERIHKTAQQNDGTYESLIRAIVMSDLVQTIHTENDSKE